MLDAPVDVAIGNTYTGMRPSVKEKITSMPHGSIYWYKAKITSIPCDIIYWYEAIGQGKDHINATWQHLLVRGHQSRKSSHQCRVATTTATRSSVKEKITSIPCGNIYWYEAISQGKDHINATWQHLLVRGHQSRKSSHQCRVATTTATRSSVKEKITPVPCRNIYWYEAISQGKDHINAIWHHLLVRGHQSRKGHINVTWQHLLVRVHQSRKSSHKHHVVTSTGNKAIGQGKEHINATWQHLLVRGNVNIYWCEEMFTSMPCGNITPTTHHFLLPLTMGPDAQQFSYNTASLGSMQAVRATHCASVRYQLTLVPYRTRPATSSVYHDLEHNYPNERNLSLTPRPSTPPVFDHCCML